MLTLKVSTVAIIGAGSWGTALAQVLATKDINVKLWARREEVAEEINNHHTNALYLPNAKLKANIFATCSYEDAINGADAVTVVTPSSFVRQTAKAIAPITSKQTPVLVCSKGVEQNSGLLMSEILAEVLGNEGRIAALSGPTHAEEVIEGQPSAAVIASSNEECARMFVRLFHNANFRTYGSTDPVGVELCAAFKNVIAIAVGVSYGIGFGDNTAAMIITRGLAEMGRLVAACGGEALTCMGLAGAGDMVVTCMSRHSRNRRFGEDYLAKGGSMADFENDTHMVVEGAIACRTIVQLATKHGVDLPICAAVEKITWEGADVHTLAESLLSRPLKPEFYGM